MKTKEELRKIFFKRLQTQYLNGKDESEEDIIRFITTNIPIAEIRFVLNETKRIDLMSYEWTAFNYAVKDIYTMAGCRITPSGKVKFLF